MVAFVCGAIFVLAVLAYAACVAGGRADDEIERFMNEHPGEFE